MPLPYTASRPLGRLNTGKAARLARALTALHPYDIISLPASWVKSGCNASTSLVLATDTITVLVSYSTAVAFSRDGAWVATPRGHYSKTTDRAITAHCPRAVMRLEVADFERALAGALA